MRQGGYTQKRGIKRAVAIVVQIGMMLLLSGTPLISLADSPKWSLAQVARPLKNTPMMPLAAAVSGDAIVVVGAHGAVVRLNQGQHRQIAVPTRTTLTSVYFVDERHGWAAGYDGVILHSKDGGVSWAIQRHAYGSDDVILALWFANPQEGYAIGQFGLVLRTFDGGVTWQKDHLFQGQKFDRHLFAMTATAQGTWLIASESGVIFLSEDKGQRWQKITTPSAASLWALAHHKGQVVAVGLRGAALRSEDGGRKWQLLSTTTQSSLTAAVFATNGTLEVVGNEGVRLQSNDGGRRFTLLPVVTPINYTALVIGRDGQTVLFPLP